MKELQNLVKSLSSKEKRMISDYLKAYPKTKEVPKILDFFKRISAFSTKVKYKISYNKQMFQNKKDGLTSGIEFLKFYQ